MPSPVTAIFALLVQHILGLEEAGEIGPADGGADPPAALQKRADDMAAEEPGAAEYRDQSLVGERDRHGRVPGRSRRRSRVGVSYQTIGAAVKWARRMGKPGDTRR